MSAGPRLQRRAFLLGAAGLGLALAWRPLGWLPVLGPKRLSGPERLARVVEHADSARVVGRAYLDAVPTEASAGMLAALVVERLRTHPLTLATSGDDRLRELLRRAAAEDFEREEVVALRGWILARTEARLYAIVAARESDSAPS